MADVSTEVAIATQTLGSANQYITFSSIPSTYTDLRLTLVATSSNLNSFANVTFNSDTSTNYSTTWLYGTGSSASSSRLTSTSALRMFELGVSNTIPQFYTMDIFSYAGSTYKTALCSGSEDRNGSGEVSRNVGLWRSTSAINTLRIDNLSGTFSTGTTATLYGIL